MKDTLVRPVAFVLEFFLMSIFIVAGFVLQQSPARGYGYGYGTCTADAPTALAVASLNHGRRIHFSWETVTFADCNSTVDHYRFQVRLNNSTLVLSDDSLQNSQKNILLSTLKRNHVYKFRVKAVASDGSTTDWSDYKLFRTSPKPPQNLVYRYMSVHRATVKWDNVPRSQYLRYYQVMMYRGNTVVFRKKIRVGLHKRFAAVSLHHLRFNTQYTFKVRAVANQATYSKYTTQKFTHRPN